MAYRSIVCTLLAVTLHACGTPPSSINPTDSVRAQVQTDTNSRPGGDGVEYRNDDALSDKDVPGFDWESLQRLHTIKNSERLEGKDFYNWNSPNSNDKFTETREFVFYEDGRFAEKHSRIAPASLSAHSWMWWGSYRLDNQTLELVYQNGDRQKHPSARKPDGIVIDNKFYKHYDR